MDSVNTCLAQCKQILENFKLQDPTNDYLNFPQSLESVAHLHSVLIDTVLLHVKVQLSLRNDLPMAESIMNVHKSLILFSKEAAFTEQNQ